MASTSTRSRTHRAPLDTDAHVLSASRASGIGPATLARWCEAYGSLAATAKQLEADASVRPLEHVERSFLDAMTEAELDRAASALDAWRTEDLHVVTWASADYPDALRNVAASPPVLFSSRPWPRFLREPSSSLVTVAIVGTRRPSAWGRSFAGRIAAELALRGAAVVSGLALGIDGAAHRAVMDVAPDRAVAVLGSSLDRVHPQEHADLAKRIAADGLLVSEFLPGTSASRSTFPRRNRIISGLSRAVVVVEAGERSGVEHTITYALEQGRDVYVVVSAPDGAYGLAAARRAKAGAIPFTTVDDLLGESCGSLDASTFAQEKSAATLDASGSSGKGLSPTARTVLGRARAHGGGTFDQLVPDDVNVSDGIAALEELTREGFLQPSGPGSWTARRSTMQNSFDGLH